jgi:hypothetical protein
MALSSSKRALSLIEGENLSPEELDQLAILIRDAAEKKRRLSPLDRARSSMRTIQTKYDAIAIPSDNWKHCASAVSELEAIQFSSALNLALELDDANDRWTAGLELTVAFSSIMFDAEQWGYKLVNGSAGEFCPDLGALIEDFWRQLISKPGRPSDEVIRQLRTEKLGRCLGDYGDLEFVLGELEASRVSAPVSNATSREPIIFVHDLVSDGGEDS